MDGKSAQDALSTWRLEWLQEINNKGKCKEHVKQESVREETNAEQVAEKLYLKGVENEENGRLYEAIQFYKKAVQLVPDIESKLYESLKHKQIKNDASQISRASRKEINCTSIRGKNKDLISKLHNLLIQSGTVCMPKIQQVSTHISVLPVEIIIYILRWVVSSDLDLRSLEMCSMVSRGFYVCSRDAEIWKTVCTKIWGYNCGQLTDYVTWRQMYLKRPHLNFNGCYISKTTYMRHGENSWQDIFYRPWHVIEYYRYLRFFPEGQVVMLTTPDQPAHVVSLVKCRDARNPSALTGHYRLLDDRIMLVLQRQDLVSDSNNRYRNKRNNNLANDSADQAFHIELQIMSNKHRVNNQLSWKYYCIVANRGHTETKTDFQVTDKKFPPFWYSRVKSYTAESVEPLL